MAEQTSNYQHLLVFLVLCKLFSFLPKSQTLTSFSVVQDDIYASFCLIVFGFLHIWAPRRSAIKFYFFLLNLSPVNLIFSPTRRTLKGTGESFSMRIHLSNSYIVHLKPTHSVNYICFKNDDFFKVKTFFMT